jgi:hypothetical protein
MSTPHNNSERDNLQLDAASTTELEHRSSTSTTQKLLIAHRSNADIAKEYRNANLSIIPIVDGSKNPTVSWTKYQTALPTDDDIKSWWSRGSNSIGLVGGKVSRSLEIIDIDEKCNIDDTSLFDRWKELVDNTSPGLVDRLPRQTTRSGGYHVLYRCSVIEGNQVLAERAATVAELELKPNNKAKTLIETRGQGGYILCDPSPGYSIVNGCMTSIPEITPDERAILFSAAHALNQLVSSKLVAVIPKSTVANKRPGDDYNLRCDHKELLEKHGWKYEKDNKLGNELWRRPGKDEGVSASYEKDMRVLYIHSSSVSPLESGKAYTLFSLFTHWEANGDYSEAARKLSAIGYGDAQVVRTNNSVGNGSNNPKILIAATEDYLSSNYEFRKNIILGQIEMKGVQENDFYKMEDYELHSLHINMLKQNIAIGHDMLKRFLDSAYVVKYDPFVEYFKGLPAWDETTDFIGQLASSVHLKDTSEAQQFANNLKRWFIGYVATAIAPDAVNQAAIIFAGAQGIQKTRWFKRIVPLKLANYQLTGTIDPDNKDTRIYLAECLLINLDEMETMRKAEIGSLKSIMTLDKIKVRRPYASFPEDMVRRASFVGSINATEFLDDPTGTRRFLTFEVESFDFEALPDIDLVMAHAYSLYKAGERWWFEDHEIAQINERNKNHSVVSYEEELLLLHTSKGTGKSWLTASEIAKAIKANDPDFRVDGRSIQKIGKALTKHGYISKKSNGIKSYDVLRLTGVIQPTVVIAAG